MTTTSYPLPPNAAYEAGQLAAGGADANLRRMAQHVLRAENQLGALAANTELEGVLRGDRRIAAELDQACAAACAAERAGQPSYRFPR